MKHDRMPIKPEAKSFIAKLAEAIRKILFEPDTQVIIPQKNKYNITERLIKDLEKDDWRIREAAAKTLARTGDSDTVLLLANLMKNRNSRFRMLAVEILGEIGTADAVQPLTDALEYDDIYIRRAVNYALGKTGDPSVIHLLVKALEESDETVRANAARSLGQIGSSDAAQPLIYALKDKSSAVRCNSTDALKKINCSDAVLPLIELLKDKNKRVSLNAALALTELADVSAIPIIIDSFKGYFEYVRSLALYALDEVERNTSVRAAVHNDASVENIIGMLKNINDQDAVVPLINFISNEYDIHVGMSSVLKLSKKSFTDIYLYHYRYVRQSAADVLCKTGNSDTIIQLFVDSLKDNDPAVREIAAIALGKAGTDSPNVIESLVSALNDQNENVCLSAAEALGNSGNLDAVEPLVAALKEKNTFIRMKAVKSLEKIGETTAIKPLIEISRAASLQVSDAARLAVIKILSPKNSLQIALQKAYPYLLCSVCFVRAEKIKVKPYMSETYTFIGCRHCNCCQRLIKGIRQTVGLIGGDIENFSVNGDRGFVSVWSEQEKKARNADIDILEIRESENISYDYAVNAVLITLKNDVSRPPEYIKTMPVAICGNPAIPKGAMLILEHEFGEITKKESV
ncbi:MAG: HEAT repeat domain-containing protein [Desulfobacterales bacterium]|nr:HEAT repeat domain-containing protein [Desulfobacterales bacterium]